MDLQDEQKQSAQEVGKEQPNLEEKKEGGGFDKKVEAKPTSSGEPEKKDSGDSSLATILMVEDDLPMVKMYSTKLKVEGFQVLVTNDGETGLAKLKEEKVDLVLLDLMIPKIGGMEVLERMRKDEKTKNIPVIILSNLSQEEDMARSKELGVRDFLIKSNHTPSQVVQVVKGYF